MRFLGERKRRGPGTEACQVCFVLFFCETLFQLRWCICSHWNVCYSSHHCAKDDDAEEDDDDDDTDVIC